MKRILTALLAAIGVHQSLSAQQKHDISVAAVQAAPGAVAAGGAQVSPHAPVGHIAGLATSEWLFFASFGFILLQCGYLIWKWRRDARRDREHQSDREAGRRTSNTGLGELEAEE